MTNGIAILKRQGLIKLGKRVYISVFTLVAALAAVFSDEAAYPLILICGIVIHEAGHVFAMRLFGVEIERLCVYPFGAEIRAKTESLSYSREGLVMLSGAAANLTAGLVSILIWSFFPSRELLFFAFCNAFFAITNLIPVRSLDGGRALEAYLCKRLVLERALSISKNISVLSYSVLCTLFLILFFESDCNLSFIIVLAYTALSAFLAEKLFDGK